MKKVAVIGTVGVPAKYGGFETLVENLIGECCSEDVDYTVFCSGKAYPTRLKTYKNARLEYVPLHANGMQSIPYDIWSLIRTVGRGYDVVLILGVSGCLFLPLYRLLFRKRIGRQYRRLGAQAGQVGQMGPQVSPFVGADRRQVCRCRGCGQ